MKYVEDQPIIQGQLFGAPVLSTQGNAEIDSIDSSHALVSQEINQSEPETSMAKNV